MKIKQNFFYSIFINPYFYVSALIFTVFCSIHFFYIQNFFASNSTDLQFFFKAVPYAGVFIFPLICLTGENKYFLPQKELSIIINKWLSCFFQYELMLLPLLLIPLCVSFFGTVDAGTIFCGFFMLSLFGASSISLCILISNFIISIPISFIVCSVSLLLTNIIHLFSVYSNNPILNLFVKIFSFAWHFDSAQKGILDSRDILYYAISSILLLYFTSLILEIKKGKIWSKKEKINFAFLAVLILFTSLDISRIYFRFDLTKTQKNSVSKYSKSIIKELDSPLKITYYRSGILTNLYPQVKNVTDYLQEYCTNKNTIFELSDPDKKNIGSLLQNYGIYSHQLQSYDKNKTEYINVFSAIVIEYKENWEVIPFILSSESLEYDLTQKVLHLLNDKKRIVNILVANNMNLENDYSYLVPWLNNQGFICKSIELYSPETIEEQIDKSSSLLMIIGSGNLNQNHCKQIENLILQGFNILAFVSPYSTDIEKGWNITQDTNQIFINMLENYGFGFEENLVADLSCARIVMESNQNSDGTYIDSTYTQNINYPLWISLLPQNNAKQGITEFWAVGMQELNTEVHSILYSSPYAWSVTKDKYSSASLFLTNPFQVDKLNTEKDNFEVKKIGLELKGQVTGHYSEKSRNNAHIIVIPDQYFVNSLMMGYIGGSYGDYRNLDYTVNSLLKLNQEEELAELQEKASYTQNNTMYKLTNESDFNTAKKITIFINLILIPLFIIIAFVIMNNNRKKHIRKLCNE